MKKLLLICLFSLTSYAHSDVLCNVSGYTNYMGTYVNNYYRTQVSCHTPSGPGVGGIPQATVTLGLMNILIDVLEAKKAEKQQIIREITNSSQFQLISCKMRHKTDNSYQNTIKFLVGENKAINNSSENVYNKIDDKYVRNAPFSTMTLDTKNMTLTATGSHSNYYSDNCTVEKI